VVGDALRVKGRTVPHETVPDRAVEPMTAELLSLRDAVERLPTEQRQVVELKYLVGMTNAEVADALGVSPGAVNAKQWRALRSLAEALGGER
jgi:RNA polymerase sigma-70 factor (ECF subfamily)